MTCLLRLAAFLLLPVLALASNLPNFVEVSPANSERLGVKVFVSSLAGRDRVKITHPHVVDEVWLVEKAKIQVHEGPDRVIFVATLELGLEDSSPISFWLDTKEGIYDATVTIQFACTNPDDERCRGFQYLIYRIASIAVYPKVPRRDFSRTPEGIAPTKESTDR